MSGSSSLRLKILFKSSLAYHMVAIFFFLSMGGNPYTQQSDYKIKWVGEGHFSIDSLENLFWNDNHHQGCPHAFDMTLLGK